MHSLWVLCALLFVDGATLAAASTVLVLTYGRYHEPWVIATLGGTASALGSAVQLLVLRWALRSEQPWMKRFAPSRDKVQAALERYPSSSFLLLLVARATPLPDAPLKLVAASIGYPIKLYALASFLGTVPSFTYVLALLGRKFVLPGWLIASLFGVVAIGIVIDLVRRRRASSSNR